MLARNIARMTPRSFPALQRTRAIAGHMLSTSARPVNPDAFDGEAPVLFQSNGSVRTYVLNRPSKLNALNEPMLNLLRPRIEEWAQSDLAKIVVGTGSGRSFCAGGDIRQVAIDASRDETRQKAIDFFQREFEMDYILAAMPKPYVVFMNGNTMGGGVGLSAHAQFRIATENTVFAMPETKIGYVPDVGASYFLPQLDGQLGTYLALTGDAVRGRAVYELGFATHYIPAQRIPTIIERLAGLDEPTTRQVDDVIEECYAEPQSDEPANALTGATRVALDTAFCHDTVEQIMSTLESFSADANTDVSLWAKQTLDSLQLRSPTSLKVTLQAIRKGKRMTLLEALQMEMGIASAFCHGASPDFQIGVHARLVEKTDARPSWSPSTVEEVTPEIVSKIFSYLSDQTPKLSVPEYLSGIEPPNPMQFALPSEAEIEQVVIGTHRTSGNGGILLDELLAKFHVLKRGKHGVQAKIREVIQRKCVIRDPKAPKEAQWLQWKH